jgi:hypothetical protein
MPRGGRPQALTTEEKLYVVRLVTKSGLDTTVQITRKFKSVLGSDVCIKMMMNVLRKAGLGSPKKDSKPTLST